MSIVFDYQTKSLFVVVGDYVDGGDCGFDVAKRTTAMICNYLK